MLNFIFFNFLYSHYQDLRHAITLQPDKQKCSLKYTKGNFLTYLTHKLQKNPFVSRRTGFSFYQTNLY
jgi:hypothetical protein